ncbi:hypothetical protein HG442_002075 [Candidatus Gracilibacteria bacterium]|nr:hypothetical protein [Candidatus Gracilibacteria bacterium]
MNPKTSFAHQKAQNMIRSYYRNPEKVRFTRNQFRFLLKEKPFDQRWIALMFLFYVGQYNGLSKHAMKFLLDRFEEQSNVPIREVHERVHAMTRGVEYLMPVVIGKILNRHLAVFFFSNFCRKSLFLITMAIF